MPSLLIAHNSCKRFISRFSALFLSFANGASTFGGVIAAVSLGALPVLIGAEIFVRITLGGSLCIVWEYTTYLMAITFILGAAFTLRAGGHVRVSILTFPANNHFSSLFELIASTLGAAISLFIALALSDLAWQTFLTGAVSATPAKTPLFIPRTGIACGAWLLALQMVARIVAVCSGQSVERTALGVELEPHEKFR